MTDFYNVYFGRDGDINYDTPVATMELSDTSIEIADQDLPAGSIWHYVRRRVRGHGCGLESESSPVCVVVIGDDGEAVEAAPNTPVNLSAVAIADGKILLQWQYSRDGQVIPPSGFAVYQAAFGSDFPETPQAVIIGGLTPAGVFRWTSGVLSGTYKFCVRSWNRDAGISGPSTIVMATADSDGPPAIGNLMAEASE